MEWIPCTESIPELSDRLVLVYFSETGSIETVHVEDYFAPITAGFDENGNQKYARWYEDLKVTHWMELPGPPITKD